MKDHSTTARSEPTITLSTIISETLDESLNVERRSLRSFQLIYWLSRGGADAGSFRYAAAIFASVSFAEKYDKHNRHSLKPHEAALLVASNRLIAQIYDEVQSKQFHYELLFADRRILLPLEFDKMNADLLRIRSYYETYLKVQSHLSLENIHNEVSRVIGGRTLQKKLRSIYKRQSAFVYAVMIQDPCLVRFFDEGQKSRVTVRQLLTGLQERVENGRMRATLVRAKAAASIIDPELAQELSLAWPDIEASDLHLEHLSEAEIAKLARRPRRSAGETKKAERQRPL